MTNNRRLQWFAGAALVVAVGLVYARVWSADFIWDDDAHITANPAMHGLAGLKQIWTSAKANYSPLTMTSFWLEHAAWGLAPAPFHLVTLLFHAGSGVMLWLVLRRLRVPGAWLGAAIWALHPVQVESVAWICELKNTQSAFFFLVSVWFFVRWLQGPTGLRCTTDYVLAAVTGTMAVLSKSSTVMLPVILGLVGWWQGRRRWAEARWLAPFFAVSLAASVWTIWEQKVNSMASGAEWSHGLAARCVIAGKITWFYLGKLLWPEPLIFIYPRWSVDDVGPLAWLPLLALIAVAMLLVRHAAGRAQALFLAGAYFVISLFPVLGFFDVFFFRYSFVGDHLQYLATMGPLALAGAGIAWAAHRLALRPTSQRVIVVLLLGTLGWLTCRQTRIYRNNFTLWQNTVALNPNAWIARVNWGVQLVSAGRATEGLTQYEAALRLKPQFKEVEVNVGAALLQLGRPAEAIPHFRTALEGKYGRADALNGIGFGYHQLGQIDEAIKYYQEAIETNPEMEAPRVNLANALTAKGQLPEALELYAGVVQRMPQSATHRDAFARTLLALKRVPEAMEQYRAAATIDPTDFEAQNTLAVLLLQSGGSPEALARAEAALRRRPDLPEAHFVMGASLLALGRREEALRFYQQALQLRPDYLEARTHLAGALFQLNRAVEALPHFEALAQAQPKVPEAHNNFASALLVAGRVTEAVKEYETSLQLAPDRVDTRTNYAMALRAVGRMADAVQQCEQALRLQPDFEPARQLLKQLSAAEPARTSP